MFRANVCVYSRGKWSGGPRPFCPTHSTPEECDLLPSVTELPGTDGEMGTFKSLKNLKQEWQNVETQ